MMSKFGNAITDFWIRVLASEKIQKEFEWVNSPDDVLDVAFEQADRYLKAQLEVSLAADRRAISIAQIFLGIASASAALLVTMASKGKDADQSMITALGVFLEMMSGAAAIAFVAATPVMFYFPGNWPSEIYDLSANSAPEVKRTECTKYDKYIRHNYEVIGIAARDLVAAIVVGGAAPIVSVCIYFLFRKFST